MNTTTGIIDGDCLICGVQDKTLTIHHREPIGIGWEAECSCGAIAVWKYIHKEGQAGFEHIETHFRNAVTIEKEENIND